MGSSQESHHTRRDVLLSLIRVLRRGSGLPPLFCGVNKSSPILHRVCTREYRLKALLVKHLQCRGPAPGILWRVLIPIARIGYHQGVFTCWMDEWTMLRVMDNQNRSSIKLVDQALAGRRVVAFEPAVRVGTGRTMDTERGFRDGAVVLSFFVF